MSKKGVSLEEKKSRMLDLLYETGECYQLKELEKLAPKLKGVVANSVKDVIQRLLDDGLIESDKLGNSIFFWAFPGKVLKANKRKLEEVNIQYENTSKKLKLMETTIQHASVNEEESALSQTLTEITALEIDIATLKKKLDEMKENDPHKFDDMKEKTKGLREAVNRWTDNIFAVKTWCKKKFFMDDKTLDKQFGIPEDLDYVE
ncbi:meiotic nuclear division protein 1 homolog [Euwallacea fornicatus]|uniref:meiotic nuclear division protein 1 homolog n=1 Tax=Euwallacea fornicatus TaxID=995702 RepID=UPI0033900AC7